MHVLEFGSLKSLLFFCYMSEQFAVKPDESLCVLGCVVHHHGANEPQDFHPFSDACAERDR